MARIIGDAAERTAFDADQRGDNAGAERGAQFEHRIRVRQRVEDRAHVVAAQAVLGNRVAQVAWVFGLPGMCGALEVGQVAARGLDGGLLVVDHDIDHAIGRLHGNRPDFLGRVHAEPAAFDHGRAAHADGRAARGDDHIRAAEQRRIAGEAAAVHDADQRHLAGQPRELDERGAVEPRDHGHVGVAGPAAAAFGEQYYGQLPLPRQGEHAVQLLVAVVACVPASTV